MHRVHGEECVAKVLSFALCATQEGVATSDVCAP
jgi:hypothetical protein